MQSVENISSSIQYNDIMPGSNLKYDLEPEKIKESILLSSAKSSNIYSFTINTGSLKARLNSDNSITIFDPAKLDEVVFTSETPYMFDANGQTSNSVSVKLENSNNAYILTLEADKGWLSAPDRAYPTVIDPTITTGKSTTYVTDNYVSSNYPLTAYSSTAYLKVGNTGGDKFRSYLKFILPTL